MGQSGSRRAVGPVVLVSGGFWQKIWTFGAALGNAITTIGGWSGLDVARPDENRRFDNIGIITSALPIVGVLAIG